MCRLVNVALNRRLTFSQRGGEGRRHLYAGLVVAVLPLVATVGALVALGATGTRSVGVDLAAVRLDNAAIAAHR